MAWVKKKYAGRKIIQLDYIYTSEYTYINNNNQMLHAYELDIA